jgi:crotonobetainyl-CoA:carnitine CoA-transferase CaiB-like acyl-CoA transferase
MLSERLLQKTNEEWLKLFRGIVPSGSVNSINEVFEDEQIKARGLIVDVEHPSYGTIKQVASPIITEGSNQANSPGPALGEHTDRLLADLLSLDENEIKRLRDQGAVG